MHTEVHVHGTVVVKSSVTQAELEQALEAWLDYVDIDGLAEAKSAREDEPGVVYDRRRRVLEICWTGWVGRNFQKALAATFEALGPLSEEAAGIEITYYHEDGRDERGMVFVGPSAEAIEAAQRGFMIEDLQALLARHFGDAEISEVTTLVNQLFERRWADRGATPETTTAERPMRGSGKRQLH